MNVVYIVTSGCYSDYSIRSVFSTREAAQALIDEWTAKHDYRADDVSIETWPIDDEVRPDENHRRISVELLESGDTGEVTDKHPNGEAIDSVCWWRWTRSPDPEKFPHASRPSNRGIRFMGTVWARDFDHAIKMARDARASSIAAGDLDKVKADPSDRWVYREVVPNACSTPNGGVSDAK